MYAVAIRSESSRDIEPGAPARNHEEQPGSDDGTRHLSGDVTGQRLTGETAACPQAERHRRIEVAAGNAAEGVRSRNDGETECERDADEPDAQGWKRGGEQRTAAPGEHEPE